jgi:hypothetical protein
MHTSARSAFLHCSRTTSLTSRTAVYGPVRTVVWQGSAGDCRPYADQTGYSDNDPACNDPFLSQPFNEGLPWSLSGLG